MLVRTALGPWLALALLAACAAPDDTLFTKPPVPPVEIAPGLFRVTWSEAPDVVRGFTPDGRHIAYQTRDLPGLGAGWSVVTVDLTDGAVREEAAVYRQATVDTVAQIVIGPSGRLHVTWRAVPEGTVTCRGCPPPPPAIGIGIRRLPPTDGVALSAVPTHAFSLPNNERRDTLCASGDPSPDGLFSIRLRPAEREVLDRRVNPFGPVERADGAVGFYSDGETVWRYFPGDPAAAPDSVGPGAFPALSPDGLRLAVAVPQALDSVSGLCAVNLCPCYQETVTIFTTGWLVQVYDLTGGGVTAAGPGLEPWFDPLEDRLVVRRPDALYWVTPATGAAMVIPGTDGGYAPAVSPDGARLAFTAVRFGNPDVFYVRIR
jgi:hypothetical protein